MIICINRSEKNILPFFGHAIGAYAEKIQPVIENLEMSLGRDLLLHVIQAVQVRVNNGFALDTDDVGMGIWPVAVVPVAPIGESQLEHFTKGLDDYDVSVHRRKTHGRKLFLDLTMDRFDAGMPFAFGEDFDDRQPLGRYLVAIIP
jgi:hypothetical protein